MTGTGSSLIRRTSRRWEVAIPTFSLAVLIGALVGGFQLGGGMLLMAYLGVLLIGSSMVIVARRADGRARLAAMSDAPIAAFAFFLLPLNAVRLSPSVTLGDLCLLLLLVPFLVRVATGHALRPPLWLVLAVTLVAIPVIAQALAGLGLETDVLTGMLFVIAMAGTPILLASAGHGPGRRATLVEAWLMGAALTAAVALLDALGATAIGQAVSGTYWNGRFAGLTVHPNHLGLVAVMALPVAMWWVNSHSDRGARVGGVLLAGLLVVGVLASGSRAALITAIVIGFLSLVAQARNSNTGMVSPVALFLGSAFIVAAALIITPAIATSGLARLVGETDTSAANQAHLDAMAASLNSFYGNPLIGVGFGSVRLANNIVLQSLQAGGVLAALGLVAYFAGAIASGIRNSVTTNGLGVALSLSVIAWLVDGLFQNIIYDRFLFLPVALILSIGLTAPSNGYRLHRVASLPTRSSP